MNVATPGTTCPECGRDRVEKRDTYAGPGGFGGYLGSPNVSEITDGFGFQLGRCMSCETDLRTETNDGGKSWSDWEALVRAV